MKEEPKHMADIVARHPEKDHDQDCSWGSRLNISERSCLKKKTRIGESDQENQTNNYGEIRRQSRKETRIPYTPHTLLICTKMAAAQQYSDSSFPGDTQYYPGELVYKNRRRRQIWVRNCVSFTLGFALHNNFLDLLASHDKKESLTALRVAVIV